MKDRYVVFDVETPNRYNNRMSAIGISVIEKGIITEEYYSLVDPEQSFDPFNIRLTGIDDCLVQDAPTFPEVWAQIGMVMDSGILVAHNAVFDLGVLRKCLTWYGIEWKERVRYACTVQMGRRLLPYISHRLNDMCDYYDIALDHHHADSDSHACAQILLRYLDNGADIRDHIRTFSLTDGRMGKNTNGKI